ncbi:hypothetical protein FRB99_009028 [Tulasnella sp. 403]|nr:hypothetical protein FRB99_009028 [Tulasnella sp. 403]
MAASVSKSESAYVASSLLASPDPTRADGRGLLDFRLISVETSVAPLANGSGRALIGGGTSSSIGGSGESVTEVIAAAKLDVEDIDPAVSSSGLSCSVTCTASAYPHLSLGQLDNLSEDLSTFLQGCLQPSKTVVSPQLIIIPDRKRWHLSIEAVVISDSGNVADALMMASRAALWDLRIPRTRGLQYRGTKGGLNTDEDMEIEENKPDAFKAAVTSTRKAKDPVDFELEDYWDDGAPLEGRESLPVCVTLNLVSSRHHSQPPRTQTKVVLLKLPPIHFLDASLTEERSAPNKLHLIFSFPSQPTTDVPPSILHHTRLVGPSGIPIKMIPSLLKAGEKYARDLNKALNSRFSEEDKKRGSRDSATASMYE